MFLIHPHPAGSLSTLELLNITATVKSIVLSYLSFCDHLHISAHSRLAKPQQPTKKVTFPAFNSSPASKNKGPFLGEMFGQENFLGKVSDQWRTKKSCSAGSGSKISWRIWRLFQSCVSNTYIGWFTATWARDNWARTTGPSINWAHGYFK